MAIKLDSGKYKCFFCGKEFKYPVEADECTSNHNLTYVPMTSEEINSLLHFIYGIGKPPISILDRLKKIQKRKGYGKKETQS